MVKLKRILLSVVVIYLGIALAMTVLQRDLLYVPILTPIEAPKHYGVAAEVVTLQGEAGKLAAWYAAPKDTQPIILYFQGNSGNFSAPAGQNPHSAIP